MFSSLFFPLLPPLSLRLLVALLLEHSDVGQPSVLCVEVESVADDKLVGTFKAHKVDGHLDSPPGFLVQKHGDFDAAGLVGVQEVRDQAVHRDAGVDDVLGQRGETQRGLAVCWWMGCVFALEEGEENNKREKKSKHEPR